MHLYRCSWRLAGVVSLAKPLRGLPRRRWQLLEAAAPPWHWQVRHCANRASGPGENRKSEVEAGATAEVEAEAEAAGEVPPEVSELFEILRGEALRRLHEFGPIHLFSLCWAYSTAQLLDSELREKLTAAALQLGETRDQERAAGRSAATLTPHVASASRTHPEAAQRRGPSSAEEEAEAEAEREEGAEGPAPPTQEQPTVLQEGPHWMAFYKPPFWQVNVDSKEAAKAASLAPFEEDDDGDVDEEAAAEEQRKRPRLHAWIRRTFGSQYAICTDPVEAYGLLHRLDTQTSGVLLCAKSYVGAYWLRLQWCSYLVDKEYVCLVHGWVDRDVREVHKRIRVEKKKAPNSRRTVSTHCFVGPNGKPSYTEVCTLAHLSRPRVSADAEAAGDTEADGEEPFSLVVLKLHTGRTHQIRVHMQSIGHPLVCDVKYAEDRFPADRAWCPRNFLHTYSLCFQDVPAAETRGEEGPLVKLSCPLPADLRASLALLKPLDEASALHAADWLSEDGRGLRSFEEYAASARGPEGPEEAVEGQGGASKGGN